MKTENFSRQWFKKGFIVTFSLLLLALTILTPISTALLNGGNQPDANAPAAVDAAKILLIPAADFKGDYDNHPFYSTSDGFIRSNGTATTCLTAPVYLPRNAVITQMIAFVYDNDASDLTVKLMRKNYGNTSLAESVAEIATTGANTNVQSKSDDSLNLVVTDFYTFYVVSCLGATTNPTNHRLYAVRIFYAE